MIKKMLLLIGSIIGLMCFAMVFTNCVQTDQSKIQAKSVKTKKETNASAITGESARAQLQQKKAVDSNGYFGIWSRGIKNPVLTKQISPFLKGSFVAFEWRELEPEPGKFDWKYFDNTLKDYTDAGLYIQLMIWVGPHSPRWLYDQGVPEVFTDDREMQALGRHVGWSYPYYIDEKYEFYFHRTIKEVAAHIDHLPSSIREKVIAIQTGEGCTGDEGPYKGVVLDKKYKISNEDWLAFKQRAWLLWESLYRDKNPKIHLIINQGNNAEYEEWIRKNMPDTWGKAGHVGHAYQISSELFQLETVALVANQPNINGNYVRFRSEMDETAMGWFQEAPKWNTYWLNLWNLHFGVDILQWASLYDDPRLAEAFVFFNKYAGHKLPEKSPGAFCALRDGLDASDTERFPKSKYGNASKTNKDRYLAIAKAFSDYGAKQGDPAAMLKGGPMAERRATAMNDVSWTTYTGNYQRYIKQYDPNGTSQGYWHVGTKEQQYGRFARGFDTASGKDKMYFDLDDNFFSNKAPDGGHKAVLRIVYFDKGNGSWEIKYDAVDQPEKIALSIKNTNTNLWKEVTVDIHDGNFNNRCPNHTDIMLVHKSGEDTLFHMIELMRY